VATGPATRPSETYGQESLNFEVPRRSVMSTELVILMLLLLAIVVLDLTAPRWGADSRRLDPFSHMPR